MRPQGLAATITEAYATAGSGQKCGGQKWSISVIAGVCTRLNNKSTEAIIADMATADVKTNLSIYTFNNLACIGVSIRVAI